MVETRKKLKETNKIRQHIKIGTKTNYLWARILHRSLPLRFTTSLYFELITMLRPLKQRTKIES